MKLSFILFIIGILGFIFNRKNVILMLISIEIMLLSITFSILISSLNSDDIIGQVYAIYIIVIAGAESAIGLSILVSFYRLSYFLLFYYLSYSKINIVKLKNNFDLTHFRETGIRNYSTVNKRIVSVDPWFITGLYDAESSFVVVILKNPRYKSGWNVQARVQIKMHEKDRALLLKIQEYFGGIGNITKPNNNLTVEYRVYTLNDIVNIIIPHFDNYPLRTKKLTDYLLFKQVVLSMLNKEHSTIEGIKKIVNIKASLNTGLSESLKEAFPDTEPVQISEISENSPKKLNSEWMAGFCTGESNFFITVQKSKTKSGLAASLRFSVAQHSRDLLLLESFVDFFGCGCTANYKNRLICEYIVTKIDHITEFIIPFFEKHPILGSKNVNYLDFKDASTIIKNKDHLNQEGLEKVLQLKIKMTSFYKNNTVNNHN